MLGVLLAFPVVLVLTPKVLGFGEGLSLGWSLAMGAGAMLALIAAGLLMAVLRGGAGRTLVFDDEGVIERVGDKSFDRGWAWIRDVDDEGDSITLHCEEPMRSLRISSSSARRVLVIDGSRPEMPILRRLVAEHVRRRP